MRIERLALSLAVGIYEDEREPQPVWVSLLATARTPVYPQNIGDCVDYEPLLRWLTSTWPGTPHTPLLETRANELASFVFAWDHRVHRLTVGIYKQRMSQDATAVGIERTMNRAGFVC